MIGMVRLKAIVSENGEVSVLEEQVTTFSNNDIVMDEVSYDIIGNMEFEEQLEQWISLLPTWLQKLVRYYSK